VDHRQRAHPPPNPEPTLFEQPWPEGELRFFQLGFVVPDLLRAATDWSHVHGVGPFHVLPPVRTACTYRGTDSEIDMQIAVAQTGPVQIELLHQRDDEPSIYRDLFAAHEGGFHQLCTVTFDYDAKRAHYEGLGYELVCEIVASGQRVAHYDTVEHFGFFTEVVEHTDEFLAQVTGIARTCATWDGSDPVRIVTRGGYRTP